MPCNEHDIMFGGPLTTDATPTEIFRYTPPVDTTVDLEIGVIARAVGAGTSALFLKRACVKNQSGTTLLVGTVADIITARKDLGATAWAITGAIEGADIVLSAVGALATDIQWLVCSKVIEFGNG